MPLSSSYLSAIQKFEGFAEKAQWDYAQYTNGYGTRALSANETITRAEAERRFKSEIGEARALVDRFAPDLDEGTRSALTSLTFNAGTAWMKSGLGRAVQGGDLERVREIFVLYNKAGGEVLPGLVARRAVEVSWIGDGGGSQVAGPATINRAPAESVSAALAITSNPPADPAGQNSYQGGDWSRGHAQPSSGLTSRAFVNVASTQLLAKMTLNVLDFLARTDAADIADADQDERLDA